MPVILELPVSAVSPQEVYRTEKQKVVLSQISPTGYMCSIPVTCVDKKVDFTDIPSGSTIEMILKPDQKPVTFKVKDGVKVTVQDPLMTHTKVTVKTESDDRFRVKDYAYLSTENNENINGEYEFNDPDFHGPEIKTRFKIGGETFERIVDAPEEREIYCRHLAMAALRMKNPIIKNAWSTSREVFLHPLSLPNIFKSIQTFEDMCIDIHVGSQFQYGAAKEHFGPVLHAMCKNLSKHMEANKTLEVKFYVTLNSTTDNDDPGHSCALVLKLESDKDNNKTFKVKFYDPNMTYNHMTFATHDLDKIKKLTFEDLCAYHKGYEDYDAMGFFELNPDWSKGVSQVQTTWNESKIVHGYVYDDQSDKFEPGTIVYLKKNLDSWGFNKIDEKELPPAD